MVKEDLKNKGEFRKKEFEWQAQREIMQQKIDQLQIKCDRLQDRFDSQQQSYRSLMNTLNKLNDEKSLYQLNKIEGQLDEIKNFNSSQRQVLKKYIQDLMFLIQSHSNFPTLSQQTSISFIGNLMNKIDEKQLISEKSDQEILSANQNQKFYCFNCLKQLQNQDLSFIQDSQIQKQQFKKKKIAQKLDLGNSIKEQQIKETEKNQLNSESKAKINLNSLTEGQTNYSIHSDDDFENQGYQINLVSTEPKKNINQHKRVNSDSIFLPGELNKQNDKQEEKQTIQKNIQENKKDQKEQQQTPQFNLEKQQNININFKLKSARNLMQQFDQDFKEEQPKNQNLQNQSSKISINISQNQKNLSSCQKIEENNKEQDFQDSQIQNESSGLLQKQKIISFSNIDQIQEVNKDPKNNFQSSIDKNLKQKNFIKNENSLIISTNHENLLNTEPNYYDKHDQQSLKKNLTENLNKKDFLNESSYLKTLLSQTSKNYSNTKQKKKSDWQQTQNSIPEVIEEIEKKNSKIISHSSNFEQNKNTQNLFQQNSNQQSQKEHQQHIYETKKSEGNLPNFEIKNKLFQQTDQKEQEIFNYDLHLDYKISFFQDQKNHKESQILLKEKNINQKNQNIKYQNQNQKKLQKNSSQVEKIIFKDKYLEQLKEKIKKSEVLSRNTFTSHSNSPKIRNRLQKNTKQSFLKNKPLKKSILQTEKSKENIYYLKNKQSSLDTNKSQNSYQDIFNLKKGLTQKQNQTLKQQQKIGQKSDQKNKKENFQIKLIKTELIKIPQKIKRITIKNPHQKKSSPRSKRSPLKKIKQHDSLKELQQILNLKFHEINKKIHQLKIILLIMLKIILLIITLNSLNACPGVKFCRQCSHFDTASICTNCESTVWNFQTQKCESPNNEIANCSRYNNGPNQECIECTYGYRLTAINTCEACESEDCAVCSKDKSFCESCFAGIVAEKGKCTATQCDLSYCAICDSSQSTCLKCVEHYSLKNAFCQTGLENCVQLKKGEKLACEICALGYFIDENNFCRINSPKSYKVYFLLFFCFVVLLFIGMLLYHKVLKKERIEETYLSIENQLNLQQQK